MLSFNKATFVPDKASRQHSSVQCKIPACQSTEHCPGGILSLRWQSQIPAEIDGLLSSLCGEPFSWERWLLSFCKHFWLAAWQTDKHKNTERKARAIDRQMPATHTETCWAPSTHAPIGRLAGKMEMKADRELTYACATHAVASMQLCMHTHTHCTLPPNNTARLHSCRLFSGQRRPPATGEAFCYCQTVSSPVQTAPSSLLSHCAASTRWLCCFWQAVHSRGVTAVGQVRRDGVRLCSICGWLHSDCNSMLSFFSYARTFWLTHAVIRIAKQSWHVDI